MIESFEEEWVIRANGYRTLEFTFAERGAIEYSAVVSSGPELDFIVIDRSEFSEYRDSVVFSYYREPSRLATKTADVSVEVEAGEYMLLVDNSRAGRAEPPEDGGDSTAEVSVTLKLIEI